MAIISCYIYETLNKLSYLLRKYTTPLFVTVCVNARLVLYNVDDFVAISLLYDDIRR